MLLHDKGDLAAAEPLYREALKALRETLGSRHPNTLASINNLGTLLYDKGDLAAAEPLLREALEVQRATLGDRHPSTLASIKRMNKLRASKAAVADLKRQVAAKGGPPQAQGPRATRAKWEEENPGKCFFWTKSTACKHGKECPNSAQKS